MRLGGDSRRRLLDAADANLVLHKGWIAQRTAGMEFVEDGRLVVVNTGLPLANFNVALRSRLDAAGAQARVARVVQRFRDAAVPFSWWAGDHDGPAHLPALLADAGLRAEDAAVIMALDLEEIGPAGDGAPELRIEEVRDEAALRHFAEVTVATWTPGDDAVLRYYAAGAPSLLARGAALRFWVGYVDGTPVATAELAVGPGLVGIYNIATLATHRRRGYGAVLTLHPLQVARAEGFHTAILQATPEGERVYRRLGFRPIGRYSIFADPSHSRNRN